MSLRVRPRLTYAMGDVRTRCYREGRLDHEDFPVAAVSEHLERPGTLVWIDFRDPTADDLAEVAGELGLHELAVEDALEPHQRSKIDRYATHLFMAAYAARLDRDQAELVKSEVDAFVGNRWLVTVRSDDGFDMAPVLQRWDSAPELVAIGIGFLLYAMLDVIVDGYFDAISQFDDYYDEVGDGIFSDKPVGPDEQREWFEMRRTLTRFYRLVAPLREALSGLLRRERGVVHPELLPYYQDLYDHVLVVSEGADSLRDLVSSLVEANLSLRDYRQNLVMKKVTSWAAIIAVPTLITGYYGMNVPYPGFERHWGVYVSTALMVLLSAGLYGIFKRRDWL
jgi:magnesium transporter